MRAMGEVIEAGALEGVASTTIKKLHKAGLVTLEAIAVTPPREIVELTGMGVDTAIKVNTLARLQVDPGFVSASDLLETRKHLMKCRTGSSEFDRIMGGGIETGVITEFIGEFGSGKTQICYTLSVLAQRPTEEGGLGGRVCVIDTEGTFLPERIVQIAQARGYDIQEILSNVLIARAYNSEHQIMLVKNLPQVCQEHDIKLVIVDSMIGHFRGEYIGRGTLAERQQKIGSVLGNLLRVAEAFNLSVVLTNQVQAKPDQAYGDPNKPAGGHVMAHACTHRVYLRKGRANTRLVQVIDSPYLPEEKIRIAVTEAGICDEDGNTNMEYDPDQPNMDEEFNIETDEEEIDLDDE
ncbi:DNA repair and recombination protein RadA [Candidatus Bathyarchaeota archaeon]|nr:DNA repair and recombination protein RadA [Candidatus Bathyarchaeota archaeon]TFH14658.1 MAG: DNA repair and recombination protein RadA [Candidatus Bathyarchaeota archaeon]